MTDDPDEALAAAATGSPVVLIVAPGRYAPARSGRLAVLVGDPADPAVRRAAAEMEAELYPGGG